MYHSNNKSFRNDEILMPSMNQISRYLYYIFDRGYNTTFHHEQATEICDKHWKCLVYWTSLIISKPFAHNMICRISVHIGLDHTEANRPCVLGLFALGELRCNPISKGWNANYIPVVGFGKVRELQGSRTN